MPRTRSRLGMGMGGGKRARETGGEGAVAAMQLTACYLESCGQRKAASEMQYELQKQPGVDWIRGPLYFRHYRVIMSSFGYAVYCAPA